ncbi:MAG: glycoside hydrolase domain-containing protein, partial [Gemmatimonadota bacterium]
MSGRAPVHDIQVTFDGFPDSWTESLTCFNCQGIDEKGQSFTKAINVAPAPGSAETVQPLWIGVRIPEDQRPGRVEGTATVTSSNAGSKTIHVSLEVQEGKAINGGADEPDLQTRLAWFNSTVGTDPDFIIEPFEPVTAENSSGGAGHALSILGRRIELGPTGLPEQIFSYFTPELTYFADEPEPILAQPLGLVVKTTGHEAAPIQSGAPQPELFESVLFEAAPFDLRLEARGRARWTAESSSDRFRMTVDGTLEYDGMLDYRISLVALDDVAVADINLPVSLVPDAAEYMLGLGRKGGKRPASVDWKWAVENHQEGVWLGGIHKGLQFVLRDDNYVRPLNTNFYQNQPLNLPPSWYNGGQGGIRIVEERISTGTDADATVPASVTAYNYS